MTANQGGPAGGGFLQILGMVYLIKSIRRRREQRRLRKAEPAEGEKT